jgi:hypothetical protein
MGNMIRWPQARHIFNIVDEKSLRMELLDLPVDLR